MVAAQRVKKGKYTQCNSCLEYTDVFDILIGKCENNRSGLMLCDKCMRDLINQCNDETAGEITQHLIISNS